MGGSTMGAPKVAKGCHFHEQPIVNLYNLTRLLLSNARDPLPCEKIEILADDKEAKDDAQNIIRAGFDEIRQAHDFPNDWPPVKKLKVIVRRVSGHLGLASFIVKFMKATDDGWDRDEKFDLCAKVVSGSEIDPGALNPVAALDSLYHEILSRVHARTLPTTMRILGFSVLYSDSALTVLEQAEFLSLEFTSFAEALRLLHSLIDVPTLHDASSKPIRLYHASFSDFLKDRRRSGRFCLDGGATHGDVVFQSIRLHGNGHCNCKSKSLTINLP
jgi:hypothetical protein